ncbi:hypothetical protein MRX96_040040 [Rhipicephalus microplus]
MQARRSRDSAPVLALLVPPLAGCNKSQESQVDSGEPESWPLDSSRSPSELVLLVSSPALEPAFKGAGVADAVRASSVPRGSSNCQWSGKFVVV